MLKSVVSWTQKIATCADKWEFERMIWMIKYEYKFVKHEDKLGFNYDKKVLELEKKWNELGQEGWKFCTDGNAFTIFMREVSE